MKQFKRPELGSDQEILLHDVLPLHARASVSESAAIRRYSESLHGAMDWIRRSIAKGRGGSAAYFGAWGRWSAPYPETTGYLIPTLLEYANFAADPRVKDIAVQLGEWLVSIQDKEGYWNGGTHPPRRPGPSIFNTGQILLGLCALYREAGDERWIHAANAAADWLSESVGKDGTWSDANYQDGFSPSYYTRVAWPMLEVWELSGRAHVREAAERVLDHILTRRTEKGGFAEWGFRPGEPGFTHTIAYTLRGFIESSRLLGSWQRYGQPTEAALDHLFRQAELSGGRLPGMFDHEWHKTDRFVCLTGNAQLAICLLKYEEYRTDLRLVNAACKLVDYVCDSQSLKHPIAGFRGGIAGSRPIWGRYLVLRYPNWAAKFFCDALMLLIGRLKREWQ